MSHIHSIMDTDSHFYIDPVTRLVSTKADKLYVAQYDHDSERFTFQIPRYVEEHDMSLCDRIEIHYSNITRNKKQQNDDVYIVKTNDRAHDNDTFFFSWLISGNATQLVGSLKFSVTFLCFDNNKNVTYEWSTTTYDNVQVLMKFENAEAVRETYPDLYLQLKQDILDSVADSGGTIDPKDVEQIIIDYLQANPPEPGTPGLDGHSPTVEVTETETGYNLTITDVNGPTTVAIRNGIDGKDGVSPTILTEEIDGGYRLTITDVNGPQTVNVMHGKDGSPGEVDYEQVAQMVDDYLEANPPVAKVTINGIEPDENGNFNIDDIAEVTTNNSVDF